MSLVKKVTEITLALSFMGVIGCQKDEPKAPVPGPAPVEKPKQDFGVYLPLKSEVLVRERTRSLIKFVKFKDAYMVFGSDDVDLTLSLFLKDTGEAYIYVYWVYPEYMNGGAKLFRTTDSVIEAAWQLNEQGALVVGDEWLVITTTDVEGEYSGSLKPQALNPPPLPETQVLPALRYNEEDWPVNFRIVSEVLEAEVVDAVF